MYANRLSLNRLRCAWCFRLSMKSAAYHPWPWFYRRYSPSYDPEHRGDTIIEAILCTTTREISVKLVPPFLILSFILFQTSRALHWRNRTSLSRGWWRWWCRACLRARSRCRACGSFRCWLLVLTGSLPRSCVTVIVEVRVAMLVEGSKMMLRHKMAVLSYNVRQTCRPMLHVK